MSQSKAQSGKVKADTSAVGTPPSSTSTVNGTTESDDQPPPTIDPLKSIKYFEGLLKIAVDCTCISFLFVTV